jgi:3-methyladenine DNA glycosylase AlkC
MEPFKNEFGAKPAIAYAAALKRAYPRFDGIRFLSGLETALKPLELKERMLLWAERTEALLPAAPPRMFSILVKALKRNEKDLVGLTGFRVWPLTELVAKRGLDYFDPSMDALHKMTQCFTAEFAIRSFLLQDPERTLRQLRDWCVDLSEHVRRLVSEGSRPLLPWGVRLPEIMENPQWTMPLLEKLCNDPSDYVRLSVSNHLNDFSKQHPDLVVKTLAQWRLKFDEPKVFEKLARRACRTLIKQGDAGALALLGFGLAKNFELVRVELDDVKVTMGTKLGYKIVVKNCSSWKQRLAFDYAIWHLRSNGLQTSKVFKGRVREMAAGEEVTIEGQHSFKEVTTRRYYPGEHAFEPRLNGKSFSKHRFVLSGTAQ